MLTSEISKAYKRYRAVSGMARFERECGLELLHNKAVKAYKVTGTTAANKHQMYRQEFERQLHSMLEKDKQGD